MKINGEVKTEKNLIACDIDMGECFVFAGDDTLMMRADDYIIDVAEGTVIGTVYDRSIGERTVVPIDTELCVIRKMMAKERD